MVGGGDHIDIYRYVHPSNDRRFGGLNGVDAHTNTLRKAMLIEIILYLDMGYVQNLGQPLSTTKQTLSNM